MLERLGFKRYAYDWRAEHLPDTARELRLAREHGTRVEAVWLWIDGTADRPGKLSEANERLLAILAEAKLSTQIWVGFAPNTFEGRPDEEKVARGVEMVRYLSERAAETRSRVALYNHGDWFGEPENQIRIIEALPGREIGLVYNFHHGHQQIDRFDALVKTIRPYLWVVNLNGASRGPEDPALRHRHGRATDAAARPRLGLHRAIRRPRPRGRRRRRGDPARQPPRPRLHAEVTLTAYLPASLLSESTQCLSARQAPADGLPIGCSGGPRIARGRGIRPGSGRAVRRTRCPGAHRRGRL